MTWSCPPIAPAFPCLEVVHDSSSSCSAPCSLVALAAPVSAQLFGGIVYDPTNYANAVLRYEQLQQQLAQLITTYQQIRTQYLLLLQQSQQLPVQTWTRGIAACATPWLPLSAPTAYGTTTAWIDAANTGPGAAARLRARDAAAARRTPAPSRGCPPTEAARVAHALRPRSNSRTAASTHGLEALGLPAGPRRRRGDHHPQPRRRRVRDDAALQHADRGAQQDQRDGRHVGAAGEGHEQRAGVAPRAAAARGDRASRGGRRRASTRTSRF